MPSTSSVDLMKLAATALVEATRVAQANAATATAQIEAQASPMGRIGASHVAQVPHLVTLNVSGMLYTTTKETLLSVEGSYFLAMLGSGLETRQLRSLLGP
ncbi:Aste57867_8183 [Aphanomyces stellatus]|uniref:Aste57867_8183 protein n=1 Tax=Aphanomyces stellatus TaxID=120398 RepID=A0A485KJQ4_9STRA|nr:hypothetical protein As57867_008152 [Aphanomyces stellatus]VFT85071.1 Aste57867_8183 [Aphanomyces stellatus]